MSDFFVVSEFRRNVETGEIERQVVHGPHTSFESAAMHMEQLLKEAMENYGLDSECSDDEGNAQPGRYLSGGEAGIYAYCEYANDQLLEVASFTVQTLHARKPEIKVIINGGCIDAVFVSKPVVDKIRIEIVNCDKDYDDADELYAYSDDLYHRQDLAQCDFTCAHFGEDEDNNFDAENS